MKEILMNKYEIKPKIGLGSLLFGTSSPEVRMMLGEPEEIEVMNEGEDFPMLVWHYWEEGFSLFFDPQQDNIFTSVEIDNDEAELWGLKLFKGYTEEQIINVFEQAGFKPSDVEEHAWGEKRVTFEDLLIDLYFEKGYLISINFGAFVDKNQIIYSPN